MSKKTRVHLIDGPIDGTDECVLSSKFECGRSRWDFDIEHETTDVKKVTCLACLKARVSKFLEERDRVINKIYAIDIQVAEITWNDACRESESERTNAMYVWR